MNLNKPGDPSERHRAVNDVANAVAVVDMSTMEATSSNHGREKGRTDEPEDHGYEHPSRSASGYP